MRAWSFSEKALIVSARLASETPDFAPVEPYADGFVTSITTFQKLYEQAELKDWIEEQLPEPAVARRGRGSSTSFATARIGSASLPVDTEGREGMLSRQSSPASTSTRSC